MGSTVQHSLSIEPDVIRRAPLPGGVVPDLVLARSTIGEEWDLGASFRRAKKAA